MLAGAQVHGLYKQDNAARMPSPLGLLIRQPGGCLAVPLQQHSLFCQLLPLTEVRLSLDAQKIVLDHYELRVIWDMYNNDQPMGDESGSFAHVVVHLQVPSM
jgi:hypothetical protein